MKHYYLITMHVCSDDDIEDDEDCGGYSQYLIKAECLSEAVEYCERNLEGIIVNAELSDIEDYLEVE